MRKTYTATFDKYLSQNKIVSFVDIENRERNAVNHYIRMDVEISNITPAIPALKHGDTVTFLSTPEFKTIEITHVNFEKVEK